MSASRKLRGGTGSELTRLKALWRTLDESRRACWQERFASQETQAALRQQLRAELGINLDYDKQLSAFREWEIEQREMDIERDRQRDDERRVLEEHPEWTKDQVRDDVLRKAYFRARSTGDFKLGLAAMKQDASLEARQFEREKFTESLRSKLETGLDAVAEAFKGNDAAMQLYRQARDMITRETK